MAFFGFYNFTFIFVGAVWQIGCQTLGQVTPAGFIIFHSKTKLKSVMALMPVLARAWDDMPGPTKLFPLGLFTCYLLVYLLQGYHFSSLQPHDPWYWPPHSHGVLPHIHPADTQHLCLGCSDTERPPAGPATTRFTFQMTVIV
jgi:hypothetical protein